MTSGPPHASSSGSVPGLHVATLTYEARIWDAYLEFDDDPRRPTSYRGRLRFDPADEETETEDVAARTTVIIIEDSYEEAVAKARSFDTRQLQGLLRSCLPEPSE
jgi:hypothetical protein